MKITNTIESNYFEKILENYEFYKASFELSSDAKLVLQNDKIIRANSAALKLFSGDPEDIINKSFFKFITEYPSLSIMKSTPFECILLALDGNTYNVSIKFDQLFTRGVELILVNIRDITESMKDKIWLRIKSAAIKAATNAVIITDSFGTIIWVNPAFTKLTGYSAEEVIGQNPRILKSGMHDDLFYEEIWKTISNGNIWSGEIWNKKKDGSFYLYKQTITPVAAFNNEITHYIAIKNP